jgi:hypothetical protein
MVGMASITFDTLKFSDTLKQAGVPAAQAEAEARAFAAAIGDVDVATRRDIEDMRKDVKTDIARLENRIETMELRLTIKLGVFMAGSAAIFGAIVKFL